MISLVVLYRVMWYNMHEIKFSTVSIVSLLGLR